MKILEERGITFNDVLLVPQYSDLASRSEADTSTQIGNIKLKIPIISANMDSITGRDMAFEMGYLGAAGVLHRYNMPENTIADLRALKAFPGHPNRVNDRPAIPSIGVKRSDRDFAECYREFTDAICLDIAHGDSKQAHLMLEFLSDLGYKTIIAGNIATYDAAMRLLDSGADTIKVGIGPGSVCETRGVTGHGVPQLTAIKNVYEATRHFDFATVIADGGMNSSGDIVKALAMGANAVMTGSLLAGTDECNKKDVYRGMASAEAQTEWQGRVNNEAPEGASQVVSARGPVKKILEQLTGGIRSGMSYSGARTLAELREKAVFMMVSSATTHENGTRKI